jgi:hypothetical protein
MKFSGMRELQITCNITTNHYIFIAGAKLIVDDNFMILYFYASLFIVASGLRVFQ